MEVDQAAPPRARLVIASFGPMRMSHAPTYEAVHKQIGQHGCVLHLQVTSAGVINVSQFAEHIGSVAESDVREICDEANRRLKMLASAVFERGAQSRVGTSQGIAATLCSDSVGNAAAQWGDSAHLWARVPDVNHALIGLGYEGPPLGLCAGKAAVPVMQFSVGQSEIFMIFAKDSGCHRLSAGLTCGWPEVTTHFPFVANTITPAAAAPSADPTAVMQVVQRPKPEWLTSFDGQPASYFEELLLELAQEHRTQQQALNQLVRARKTLVDRKGAHAKECARLEEEAIEALSRLAIAQEDLGEMEEEVLDMESEEKEIDSLMGANSAMVRQAEAALSAARNVTDATRKAFSDAYKASEFQKALDLVKIIVEHGTEKDKTDYRVWPSTCERRIKEAAEAKKKEEERAQREMEEAAALDRLPG